MTTTPPPRPDAWDRTPAPDISEPSEAPEVTYVGGGDVPHDVLAWFTRYIYPLHERDLWLITLWTLHTHLLHILRITPRLQIESPLPGAGKTTLLEHLRVLCFSAIQMGAVASQATLARLTQHEPRTLLLDEVDRNLASDRPIVPDLLTVLNTGYKRGGTRPIPVPNKSGGYDIEEMSTFAPVAMAGIAPNLPDDTASRAIRVILLPDLVGMVEDSDWEEIEEQAEQLADQVRLWAVNVTELPKPHIPDLRGRQRERWYSLARIAYYIGGEWPARIHQLIDHEREAMEDDPMKRKPPAVLLLQHIIEEWPPGEDMFRTDDICERLKSLHSQEWGPNTAYANGLTTQRVGRMMAQHYGLRTIKGSDGYMRGYERAQVERVAARLGLLPTPSSVTSGASDASDTSTS